MGSQTPPKIPIIDFTKENLDQEGSSSWILACKEVRQALEDFGCFVVIYDKVSQELSNEVFLSLKELFDLPMETKTQYTGDMPLHGYLGKIPRLPHFESMGIENATKLEVIQDLTNLMWPNGNEHFCEAMQLYSKLLSELDQMVIKMVFESYGVKKYYDSHIGSINYLLRVMKYGVQHMLNETDLASSTASVHTDKSFISIIHQNHVNGLEVKTREGEWIAVEVSPSSHSSFVVLSGEAFLAWSNDRIHSALHGVKMRGNKERYAVALFSHKNGMTRVPEELVDDEHPLKFKPFDNFEMIRFHFTKEGQVTNHTAKAFCGI